MKKNVWMKRMFISFLVIMGIGLLWGFSGGKVFASEEEEHEEARLEDEAAGEWSCEGAFAEGNANQSETTQGLWSHTSDGIESEEASGEKEDNDEKEAESKDALEEAGNSDKSEEASDKKEEDDEKEAESEEVSEEIENGNKSEEVSEEIENGNRSESTSEEAGNGSQSEDVNEGGTENLKKEFDFTVNMKGAEEAKAGSLLMYDIEIRNTGREDLSDLWIFSTFSCEEMKGIWDGDEEVQVEPLSGQAMLRSLKAGSEHHIFVTAEIPESLTHPVEHTINVVMKSEETGKVLNRKTETCTVVLPLRIDYTVQKIADRAIAYPGDTINYRILIQNTGERTLHSIISTERFQADGIQALFLPQEGVALSKDCTQAYIAKLEPGMEVILKAQVVLPGEIVPQDLLNHVTVITEETGTSTNESKAFVQVEAPKPTVPAEVEIPTKEPEPPQVEAASLGVPSAEPVETGDVSETIRWMKVGGAALLLIFLIFLAKIRKRQ